MRARTDADGRYVIEGLADGEYFIGFFHPSRVPPDRNPQARDLPDVSPELARDGAPKTRSVTITGGKSVEGVDFVLVDTGVDGDSGFEVETGPAEDLGLPSAGTASDGGRDASGLVFPALGALGVAALLGGWFSRGLRRRE